MNIMVTGGAGFIASHIVDDLIKQGHQVAVIDNLTTGRLDHVNPQARFYQLDIRDAILSSAFAEFKPEIVIHHAAQIDVQTSVRMPMFDASINILGSLNVLERCIDHRVRKIIYASSAAVYGNPVSNCIREDHPVQPLNAYGVSKYTPEQYIRLYSKTYGLDYTIFRYANVYGERQNSKGEAGVVSIFIDQMLNGNPAVIFGDGEQTRDFIYVKDIVHANLLALSSGNRMVFNLGTGDRTSVNDLHSLLRSITGGRSEPLYKAERLGDIRHSSLDCEAALSVLGWKPRYTLAEGLNRTVNGRIRDKASA